MAVVAGALLGPAEASAESCAGQPWCPYKSVVSILPQRLALGPLAVSSGGDVFALESGGRGVIHLTPSGEFAGAWTAPGLDPLGIATDGKGSAVYVTNSDLGNVAVFSPTGMFRVTIGSEGTGPGQFVNPVPIVLDRDDNIYVGDSAHGIQKFNRAHKVVAVTTAAPGGTSLTPAAPKSIVLAGAAPGLPEVAGYTTSLAPTATFALPAGTGFPQVAVDSIGDIYVSDQVSDTVYQYAASGHFLTSFGGLGTSLGSFDRPSGLGIDGSDNLYASDTGNARIQKFTLVDTASTTLARRITLATARTARAAPLRIHCEARGVPRCTGTLRVLRAGRAMGRGRFSIRDGATSKVPARIVSRVRRRLARGKDTPVQVELRTLQPGGASVRTLRHRRLLRASRMQRGERS